MSREAILEEVAAFVDFYAEERMLLCGDTILHDPLLAGGRFTMDNMLKSQTLNIEGTINSAAYHAAKDIAQHIRAMSRPPASGEG